MSNGNPPGGNARTDTDASNGNNGGATDVDSRRVVADGGVATADPDADAPDLDAVPLYDLTGFQRDLLWLLWGVGPASGQEVKRELGTYGETPNHGRLYPNLDTLVERGLVSKGERNRRTNEYAVTDDGREALTDREEWETDVLGGDGE